ncbi:MAG: hypothetical protein AB199_02560 [Parcubacteria bacterium C7867-004]|nr:MAG: hypothetical protein AB199_02560 [Parcubacteria bacterium C7867-004]
MATKKTAKKSAPKKSSGKKMTKMQAAELGAGVLAAVAAAGAAGYYFYGSKNAKKHRSATSKWAKGLKADVVREAKKLKDLDEKAMAVIVENAAKAYKNAKDVTPADLKAAVDELKGNWQSVQKELRRTGSKAKSSVKKTVKKAAPKKAAKKPAAKKRK